jgi:type VI secretion system secreted protein Hcp
MFLNVKYKIAIAGMVFLATAVCAIPATASGDMFIKIAGIEGESRDKEHSGWIGVESFTWEHTGISMSGERASRTGTRQGEPAMPGSLTIKKYKDKASTPLMQACSRGMDFGDVVVEVVETDEITGIVQYSTYTLSEVNLSGGIPSDSEDRPSETITLNYETVASDYRSTGRKTGKTNP